MTARIRVLIVDDHPMVAQGVSAILETYDDINVVGTLCNGREAIDQIASLDPDVMLLDLNMPLVNGLNATEIILEKRPDTRILILDCAIYVFKNNALSCIFFGALQSVLYFSFIATHKTLCSTLCFQLH